MLNYEDTTDVRVQSNGRRPLTIICEQLLIKNCGFLFQIRFVVLFCCTFGKKIPLICSALNFATRYPRINSRIFNKTLIDFLTLNVAEIGLQLNFKHYGNCSSDIVLHFHKMQNKILLKFLQLSG